ncbi:MAG: GSCFA domain-containing protein [Paludibacteraceae bacterium]|nr:GSCFA domain-containing protein [Paludibacteraceae bacterium]
MNLQTTVHIPKAERLITYNDHILLLGSCFADEMAAKMRECYMQVISNPFGTLYNPLSIVQALRMTDVPTLLNHNGLWHSMAHHGEFSYPSEQQTRTAVRNSIDSMQNALHNANVIIVTFGTAWVYEMPEMNDNQLPFGSIVANCHKMPSDRFRRRRLTVDEIIEAWMPVLTAMPDKHWIFTVSPIRHLKDGLHENQLSKATLLMAVEQLTAHCATAQYFPAYEILQDELRDYRFYADDLVHPSSLAVEYIWEQWSMSHTSSQMQEEMRTLHRLWLDSHHRTLHPDSAEAVEFDKRTAQKRKELAQHYPWIATREQSCN